MENEKEINIFNSLIEINHDRIEGYKTAYKETEEEDLKALFAQFAHTSQHCEQELAKEVHKLGGTPLEGTKTSGKFFRVWMDVKAALTGNDRKTILDSCVYGEDVALNIYYNILKDRHADIDTEQRLIINKQHNLIKADCDYIKNLRDSLVEK